MNPKMETRALIKRLRAKTRTARRLRFAAFLDALRVNAGQYGRPLRVMDLGGTVAFWEDWWQLTDADGLEVTLINNHAVDVTNKHRASKSRLIENLCRDATTLELGDLAQFDLVFSNSFFEHLGSLAAQTKLARTIVASGLPYFIQVPNKHSPVDPHHPFAPFFGLYPGWARRNLLRVSGFGGGRARSAAEAEDRTRHYNPLGESEMRLLFPEARLEIERPLGIPMSILVSRATPPAQALAA